MVDIYLAGPQWWIRAIRYDDARADFFLACFRAAYDDAGRLVWVEKLVYGEVELRHDYLWRETARSAPQPS